MDGVSQQHSHSIPRPSIIHESFSFSDNNNNNNSSNDTYLSLIVPQTMYRKVTSHSRCSFPSNTERTSTLSQTGYHPRVILKQLIYALLTFTDITTVTTYISIPEVFTIDYLQSRIILIEYSTPGGFLPRSGHQEF